MTHVEQRLRDRYKQLKEELNLDVRFQSGMYEQVYAVHRSILVFEVDHQAHFLYTNLLFCQYTGYDPEELADQHINILLRDVQAELPYSMLRTLLEQQTWTGQLKVRTKQGNIFWMNLTITPFFAHGESLPYKFVCVGFDITNQKRQKENLQMMIRQEKEYVYELEEAKSELEQKVEEKVNEIRDSIRYSERIQKTMMPDNEELRENVPRQFEVGLLYKPRDIVSGDFYWAGRFNFENILVAGDATGHGIPGAFMSILGIGSVSKLVEERGLTNPSSILTQVDQDLRTTLKQEQTSDNNLEDSIEMVVCKMKNPEEENNHVIQLSAAMLTNFFVNKEGVTDIRGNRRPLGGTLYGRDIEFENQEVQFQPGDTLYMLSDGYPTQLGDKSKNFKPMGKKRFRELLKEVDSIPTLEERMASLDFFLKEWIGINNTQTDDIMILAIRYLGENHRRPKSSGRRRRRSLTEELEAENEGRASQDEASEAS
jgi:PAS domain S-box-containing protein